MTELKEQKGREIMKRHFLPVVGALALGSLIGLQPARAAAVTYLGSQTAEFSALPATIQPVITFGQTAVPLASGSGGITVDGVNFVGVLPDSFQTSVIWDKNNVKDWGTQAVLQGPAYYSQEDRFLKITLPSPSTVFAMNLMSMTWQLPYRSGANFTIKAGDGSEVIPTIATQYWAKTADDSSPAPLTPTWIGFVLDTPVTTLEIRNSEGFILLDNFQYGELSGVANPAGDPPPPPPEEVPEASTMLLIGTGLLALRYFNKRNPLRPA